MLTPHPTRSSPTSSSPTRYSRTHARTRCSIPLCSTEALRAKDLNETFSVLDPEAVLSASPRGFANLHWKQLDDLAYLLWKQPPQPTRTRPTSRSPFPLLLRDRRRRPRNHLACVKGFPGCCSSACPSSARRIQDGHIQIAASITINHGHELSWTFEKQGTSCLISLGYTLQYYILSPIKMNYSYS